jgi:ketosteroid isomerase-like protein
LDKETHRQAMERLKATMKLTIDLVRCVNEGGTVVVEGVTQGTGADGVQYDSPFVAIFETRDGLIVSVREYSDTRAVAEAIPWAGLYR